MSEPSVVRLLVSVRDSDEAERALAGGSDVIDIKEPSRGPLGMADPAVIAAVLSAVGRRVPVSAALGEWDQSPPPAPIPAGLGYIKVGLAGAGPGWAKGLRRRFAAHAPARPIVVAYADHHRAAAPPVDEVVAQAVRRRWAGVLIDTAVKDGRTLLDWLKPPRLKAVIRSARRAGLMVGLAGSLNGDGFRVAVSLNPDLVAVRGAACGGGDRQGVIAEEGVRGLAGVVAAHNNAPARIAG